MAHFKGPSFWARINPAVVRKHTLFAVSVIKSYNVHFSKTTFSILVGLLENLIRIDISCESSADSYEMMILIYLKLKKDVIKFVIGLQQS